MNLTLRKKIIFSLFKLFFIFTIIIIIGEIVVRYFNLGDPNTKYLYNNQIPKRLPHYKFTNFKENINIVLLNNHGFHDTDRETKNDKYRYFLCYFPTRYIWFLVPDVLVLHRNQNFDNLDLLTLAMTRIANINLKESYILKEDPLFLTMIYHPQSLKNRLVGLDKLKQRT